RQFLDQRLFRPLGMSHSLVRDRHGEPVPDLAVGYRRSKDGTYELTGSGWEQVGDRGVVTTASDLAKWAANLSTWTVGGAALRHGRRSSRASCVRGQCIYAAGLPRNCAHASPIGA